HSRSRLRRPRRPRRPARERGSSGAGGVPRARGPPARGVALAPGPRAGGGRGCGPGLRSVARRPVPDGERRAVSALLSAYHRLPAPARGVVASVRGFSLRSWRYGAETDRLVEEALDRDGWPVERWQGYREDRLSRLLHRAATRVP